MLKPLLGITAGGVLTVILWKILALALPTLVAISLGVVFWVIKAMAITMAIIVAVLLFRWLNRRASRRSA